MSPVLLEMNHHFAVLAEVWSASPTWLLALRTLSLVLASLTSAALVSNRLGGIPKATALTRGQDSQGAPSILRIAVWPDTRSCLRPA